MLVAPWTCSMPARHDHIVLTKPGLEKMAFWVLASCRLISRFQCFGETYYPIFIATVMVLESGGISIRLEKGKAEGVGYSGMNDREMKLSK
jgi:hypothetical protein